MFRYLMMVLALMTGIVIPAHTQQPDFHSLNDSAEFYLTRNVSSARYWLTFRTAEISAEQQLRRLLLAAQLEENEGYYNKSISLSRQAREQAKKAGDLSRQAQALLRLASAQLEIGKTDSILTLVKTVTHIDSTGANGTFSKLLTARYWHSLNQPAKALPFYQSALEQARTSEDVSSEIAVISGMASLYFTLEPNMTRVINLLSEAISISDSTQHANQIARNCARLANANMVLANTSRAEAYLKRAKTITDLTHNLPVESYVLSSFAILRAEQGNIEEAIRIAHEPIRMKREMGQIKSLQNDLLNIAEWQMAVKRYDEAEPTILEGIATSTQLNDYVYLFYYFRHYATLKAARGNHIEAYQHLQKAMQYKDSTIALQNARAVSEIREKYEAEQHEKLLAEKELQIQQQKNKIGVIVAVSVLVVLGLVLILIVVRNRHREKMATEKELQNKLRLQTMISTQEEVQQDIARDIHDGLVQMMGAAKLSLQAIRPGDELKSLLEKTSRASAIIDDACVEARNISHQLLPYSLMREGFTSALRELVKNSFSSYSFEGEDNLEIDQHLAVNLFRISQEIINNINKHADASFIKVKINHTAENLSLTFYDNGKGFDPMTVKKGAGLINIMTRAEVIEATVDIASSPSDGTTINISVAL